MITVRNLVPEYYYDKSRDFQVLGRALEIIFNYFKTNTDLIRGSSDLSKLDDNLVNLFASTVGFDTKHKYVTSDLKAICSVFDDLLKDKGSKKSIENACKTLMSIQNVSGNVHVTYNNGLIEIHVPKDLQDLVLLEDLFDYILPAGLEARFIRTRWTPDKSLESYSNLSEKSFNQVKMINLSSITVPSVVDDKQVNTEPPYASEPAQVSGQEDRFSTFYTGKVYKPE